MSNERIIEQMAQQWSKSRALSEFEKIDAVKITRMSPKELAAWQFEHESDSPHSILAAHEWQRRLIVEQVRWMKFSVIAAVFAAILGAIVGASLSSYLSRINPPQYERHGGTEDQPGDEPKENGLDQQPAPPMDTAPVSPPDSKTDQSPTSPLQTTSARALVSDR
ncbi:MAG TPA: hypothetical protein VMM36_13595 [Opitutaceae bacterium]|nr:hypothetical protein [Opitutaceae bacterium]